MNMEKWLFKVEEFLAKSMHTVMKKGWQEYPEQPRPQKLTKARLEMMQHE